MAPEGQLFDFLLPYPIHVFDDSVWPALHVKRADLEILLLKPISQQVSPREEVSKGNEIPDLFVTTFPAIVERSSKFYPLDHRIASRVVHHAVRWMRVLTRQYWIASGGAGVAAQYRGSAFRVEGNEVSQRNFAYYGQSTLIRSLNKSVWEALIYPVEKETPVPVSESLLCDSLTSFAVGDIVSALVQLGVASEIAITNLLDDLAAANPNMTAAKAYLQARHEHKDKFGAKLLNRSLALGLEDPRAFHPAGKPADWVELLLTLYNFRNKAAHEGRALVKDKSSGALRELKSGELQSFIFAAETLFQWAWTQRQAKLGSTEMPVSPDGQIIAIVGGIKEGGGFVLDTGESRSVSATS